MKSAKDEVNKVQTTPKPESAFARLQTAIIESLSQLSLLDRDQLIKLLAKSDPPKPSQPSPYKAGLRYRFKVTWNDQTRDVEAENDRVAWALFCDEVKKWPSPKTGKVELLGEAPVAN